MAYKEAKATDAISLVDYPNKPMEAFRRGHGSEPAEQCGPGGTGSQLQEPEPGLRYHKFSPLV